MKKLFYLLIEILVSILFFLFGLNVLYFLRYHDWQEMILNQNLSFVPTLDFSLFFADEINQRFFVILVLIATLFWFNSLFKKTKERNKGGRRMLDKYERDNYSKLLSKRERKRGTILVQYNKHGKVTRKTVTALLENIFDPIKRFQNKIAYEYNFKPINWWNAKKEFNKIDKNGEVITVNHCSGIPIIASKRFFIVGKFNKIRYLYGNHHSAFIGMTGKGKSMSLVLPILNSVMDAGESFVTNDPKGELLSYTQQKLKDEGYDVIVLNFHDPKKGSGWNPLDFPYKVWKQALKEANTTDFRNANTSEAVEMILDICNTIAYEKQSKDENWWRGAASMMAGAAQLLFEEGIDDYINFFSILMIYILGDNAGDGNKTLIYNYMKKHRQPEDGSFLETQVYLNAKSNTKASYLSVFKNKIKLMTATKDIINMTSKSTFDLEDVFNRKTAIFLLTHDEKSTYYPLVTMFFKQLYEAGIKKTRNTKDGKLPIPMTWIIDEFAVLPPLKDIENIYAAARSRGLKIYTFFQSLSQLKDKYGDNAATTILDNNTNIFYLGSSDPQSLSWFSNKAGREFYFNKETKQYDTRPVVSESKLSRMHKGRILATINEWYPYIAKLPEYKRYTFAKKSNLDLPFLDKGDVKYFDINKEFSKNIKKDLEQIEKQRWEEKEVLEHFKKHVDEKGKEENQKSW